MKLINCFVKDFGTLSDYSYDFTSGLNSVIADNGSGKSTLAVFIKTMFYGFDGGNKRALSENERKKYTPWTTRRFGGNLTFSLDDGRLYKIERFFEGSESTFKLYDLTTNKISYDFSENIGVELFGIDREGFERSTYYPQKKVEDKANTTISAKLTSLTQDTNDLNSFDNAIKIIEDFRKELTSNAHGKIQKVKKEVDDLNKKLEECEEAKRSFERLKSEKLVCDDKLAGLNAQYEKVLNEKDAALKQSAQKEINEHYSMLEKDVNECEKSIEKVDEFFSGKQVSSEDIKTLKEKLITVKGYENKQTSDESILAQTKEVEEFFKGRIVSEQEVDEAIKDITPKSVKKSGASKLLVALSVLFLLVGVGLLFVLKEAAIISFVLSGVMFFAFMFVYFNNMLQGGVKVKDNSSLVALLSYYFDDLSDIDACVSRLKTNIVKYNALKNLQATVQDEDVVNCKNSLQDYLSQFTFDSENIEEQVYLLESKVMEREKLLQSLESRKAKLEEFIGQKKVVEIEQFDLSDIESREKLLKNGIENLNNESIKLSNLLDKQQEIFENYESLLAYKEEREQEFKHLSNIAEDVALTKDFLTLSKDALNSKYLGKMQIYYKKYCEEITNSVISEPVFDSNLKFSFVNNGEVKDKEYLSEGLKDISDVCSRLALCDALYENEKPMLIFDDPFVNLDDDKLSKAKLLLKEIAKEYQIIYLVCHSSRLI